MSAGGMRFDSVPFFAMADAARSAMDDAVSKPLHGSADLPFTYRSLYQIQTTRRLGTSMRASYEYTVWEIALGAPSKGD